MKKSFIILMIIAFANLACSRYYPLAKEDLSEYEMDDEIKLILKSGREFVGDSLSYNFTDSDTTLFLIADSTKVSIQLNEVEKIYVNEIDTFRSILTGMWVVIGVVIILGVFAKDSLKQ